MGSVLLQAPEHGNQHTLLLHLNLAGLQVHLILGPRPHPVQASPGSLTVPAQLAPHKQDLGQGPALFHHL